MRKLSILAVGLALLSGPALAGDATKEINTAITHAELAVGAGDLKMVQMHLHHVLNCISGPGGMDFDATAANPCKDAGDGALKDAPDKAMALNAAAAKAKEGLATMDMATAKADATETATILKTAK